MVNLPRVSSRARARGSYARNAFINEIEGAIKNHMTVLNGIAKKYGRTQGYVRTLAGIGAYKKSMKSLTTSYAVYCGKKFKEFNDGKEEDERIDLPNFLKLYSARVRDQYMTLSDDEKEVLLRDHFEAKEEEMSVPKKTSNVALTKAVYSKMKVVTATCDDLNRQFGTESMVLFSRGDAGHLYHSCAYATDGASKWLENAEVGHTTPGLASVRMEGFVISGCDTRVTKTQEGKVKNNQNKDRQDCRMIIQAGLEAILKLKDHPQANAKMNYVNYERKIVEQFGVELTGWPIPDCIRNPGELSSHDIAILKNALVKDQCKWKVLTEQEKADRVSSNRQRDKNGESVYGPPRKPRTRKVHLIDSEIQGQGDGVVDENAA